MKINLKDLSIREIQKECARALSTIKADNDSLSRFNKQAHHNSHNWYVAVINWYVEQYGDLPSKCGPGKDVRLVLDV
mgnify:CR=1 FL=1